MTREVSWDVKYSSGVPFVLAQPVYGDISVVLL